MQLLAHITAHLIIYSALVLSLSFVVSKVNIWSVGHLGFFGVGSVTAAALLGAPPTFYTFPAAILAAALAGTLLSALLGLATLRLRQDFFVILSLAFSEVVLGVCLSWKGPAGFNNLARPTLLGLSLENDWVFIMVALLPLYVTFCAIFVRFSRLRIDRVCALIQANEELAMTLRVSPLYYKVGCFCVASASASVWGALATFHTRSTDPNQISIESNLLLFSALLFGGLNSLQGSILGGLLLVVVPSLLESVFSYSPFGSNYAAEVRQLLMGCLLIFVVRWMPRGLVGGTPLNHSRERG